jgi:hypothetical protein
VTKKNVDLNHQMHLKEEEIKLLQEHTHKQEKKLKQEMVDYKLEIKAQKEELTTKDKENLNYEEELKRKREEV